MWMTRVCVGRFGKFCTNGNGAIRFQLVWTGKVEYLQRWSVRARKFPMEWPHQFAPFLIPTGQTGMNDKSGDLSVLENFQWNGSPTNQTGMNDNGMVRSISHSSWSNRYERQWNGSLHFAFQPVKPVCMTKSGIPPEAICSSRKFFNGIVHSFVKRPSTPLYVLKWKALLWATASPRLFATERDISRSDEFLQKHALNFGRHWTILDNIKQY